MVGSYNIQPVIQQRLSEGVAVRRRLDGGVTFYQVAQPFIVIGSKMQMVHAYFSSNALLFKRQHIGKQSEFLFSTDMQYMQPAVVFFCPVEWPQGGFKTGLCIADQRVIGGRYGLLPLFDFF